MGTGNINFTGPIGSTPPMPRDNGSSSQDIPSLVAKIRDAFSPILGPHIDRLEEILNTLKSDLELAKDPAAIRKLIKQAQGKVGQTLNSIHHILHQLTPEQEETLGKLTGNQTEKARDAYLDTLRKEFDTNTVSNLTPSTKQDPTQTALPSLSSLQQSLGTLKSLGKTSTASTPATPSTSLTASLSSAQPLPDWAQQIINKLDSLHSSSDSPSGQLIQEIENWLNQHANDLNAQIGLALHLNLTHEWPKGDIYTDFGLSKNEVEALYKILSDQGVPARAPIPTAIDEDLFTLLNMTFDDDENQTVKAAMMEAFKHLDINQSYEEQRTSLQTTVNNLYALHPETWAPSSIASQLKLTDPEWISELETKLGTKGLSPPIPRPEDPNGMAGLLVYAFMGWIHGHENDPNLQADLWAYLGQYLSPPTSAANDLYCKYAGLTQAEVSEIYDVLNGVKNNSVSGDHSLPDLHAPVVTDIDTHILKIIQAASGGLSPVTVDVQSGLILAIRTLDFTKSYASQAANVNAAFQALCAQYPNDPNIAAIAQAIKV